MEIFQTILIAATATITTLLVEPLKLKIKRVLDLNSYKKDKARDHDIELFKTLSNILQEGVIRGTMYAIKVNAEFDSYYIAPADQYQLYIENYEEGRFINEKIENAHLLFLSSLKELERDLFTDFTRIDSDTFRPDKEKGMDKKSIKEKYISKVDNVLETYSTYRKLVKNEYQI